MKFLGRVEDMQPPASLIREVQDGDELPDFPDAAYPAPWSKRYRLELVRWMVLVPLTEEQAVAISSHVFDGMFEAPGAAQLRFALWGACKAHGIGSSSVGESSK